jgi:glycosyltransferase involved in cell wall biosynthesis
MTSCPTVSIGLPVFNGADLLGAAVESLLAQTFTDFELIISDNGSNDQTETVARRYAEKDPRVRYHRSDRNRGAAWNHTRVLELARGRYFKWAAHDDLCAPQFVERCVGVLEQDPAVVLCYPETVLIDEVGRAVKACPDDCALASPRPSDRFRHLLQNFGLSNPMYGVTRTAVLRSVRPLGRYPGADLPLLAELALRGRFVRVPEPLFFRRDHPGKSNRRHADLSALAAWYDPSNTGRPVLRHWALLRGHLAAVARAPISPVERASCYAYLMRWLRWNLPALGSELTLLAGSIAAPRRPRAAPAP